MSVESYKDQVVRKFGGGKIKRWFGGPVQPPRYEPPRRTPPKRKDPLRDKQEQAPKPTRGQRGGYGQPIMGPMPRKKGGKIKTKK